MKASIKTLHTELDAERKESGRLYAEKVKLHGLWNDERLLRMKLEHKLAEVRRLSANERQ